MANFVYETFVDEGDNGTRTIDRMDSKGQAASQCRTANRDKTVPPLQWDRWISVTGEDLQDDSEGEYYHESDLPVFVNNEQNTYRHCPWGGRSTLLCSDDKYDLYQTTNYQHTGKIGFYLVDNNPKLK